MRAVLIILTLLCLGLQTPAGLVVDAAAGFQALSADLNPARPAAPWGEAAISQRTGSSAVTGTSVFDGRYRYTEWIDGEKQLFDHTTDPGEWYDLSANPAYAGIMQALSLLLQ